MQYLGLIYGISDACSNKCDVCVESKLTKRTCHPVQWESKLLGLIYSDPEDLKQTMSKDGKKYFVTFIDEFSRYTKIYLIRDKDEAFDMFLLCKA